MGRARGVDERASFTTKTSEPQTPSSFGRPAVGQDGSGDVEGTDTSTRTSPSPPIVRLRLCPCAAARTRAFLADLHPSLPSLPFLRLARPGIGVPRRVPPPSASQPAPGRSCSVPPARIGPHRRRTASDERCPSPSKALLRSPTLLAVHLHLDADVPRSMSAWRSGGSDLSNRAQTDCHRTEALIALRAGDQSWRRQCLGNNSSSNESSTVSVQVQHTSSIHSCGVERPAQGPHGGAFTRYTVWLKTLIKKGKQEQARNNLD